MVEWKQEGQQNGGLPEVEEWLQGEEARLEENKLVVKKWEIWINDSFK